MKKITITILVFFTFFLLKAQENSVTLSGGYSFVKIQDTDNTATGFRINTSYEFNPMGGILAHGVAFGYIHVSSTQGAALSQETTSTVNSFPVYYAPKVMFGSEKFKVFIKGALGMQFAWLKREGFVELSDHDFGFYGGGGGGFMFFLKENIFLNAEYEIAWASNSWYKDGWMNTAMAGIGYRF